MSATKKRVTSVDHEWDNDVLVARMREHRLVRIESVQNAGEDLERLAAKASGGRLLVDFQHVQHMSSAMLGKLLHLKRLCKEDKIDLKLCSLRDEVDEAFHVTGFERLFDIHPDRDAAIRAFHRKRWLFR